MSSAGQVSSLVKDRVAAKDLGAFAKHLEELDATPLQVSSGNSLTPPHPCHMLCDFLFLCLSVSLPFLGCAHVWEYHSAHSWGSFVGLRNGGRWSQGQG